MVKQFLEGKILYEKIGEFLMMDFLKNIKWAPTIKVETFETVKQLIFKARELQESINHFDVITSFSDHAKASLIKHIDQKIKKLD